MMSKMLLSVVLYSISISLAKGIDLKACVFTKHKASFPAFASYWVK